jgi:hypothetical protein
MVIQNVTDIIPLQADPRDIDDSPGPCCMSFGFDLKPLIQSIKKIGLINSPLVMEQRPGNLTVISGYRRILALKSLKWDRVPCRVLSESQLSPLDCLLINLHENLATRKLNEIEKGMILSRLGSWLPRTEVVKHYMALLALPAHEPTFLFFVRLEQELDREMKEYLVRGRLSLKATKMLLETPIDAMRNIFRLLSSLKFNFNQQEQLIEYITDLLHMNADFMSDVFEGQELVSIRSDTALNNPQKAKAILRFLRARRFPLLDSAERAFKKKALGLALPDGVKISAPRHFEGPHYRLEVLFKDGRELTEKIDLLSRTEGMGDLGDPWEEPV